MSLNESLMAPSVLFRFRKLNFDTLSQLIKWFKENFREPVPGTPSSSPAGAAARDMRTPYGSQSTPNLRPGITPGAMSMAGGSTPYTGTPGYGSRQNAAYTPTANTPAMTPFLTPG